MTPRIDTHVKVLQRAMDREVEHLLRILGRLPHVATAMADAMPAPSIANYEPSRPGSIIWCDDHEREQATCARLELGCKGVPLPEHHDPTGDAAANIRAWADAQTIEAGLRAFTVIRKDWDHVVRRWDTVEPSDVERDAVGRSNQPNCERHLRYAGKEVPSRTKNGTRVRRKDGSFVLTEDRRLCKWCEETTLKLGRLPNDREVRDHDMGKRLRVTA